MIRKLIKRKLDAAERELGESHEYVRYILRTSLRAFFRFTRIFPISNYRGRLPADAYHVARIVAAREEDCGTCVQIEVNLGLKSKVSATVLQSVIDHAPEHLSARLQLVYRFVEAVVNKTGADLELRERVVEAYGQKGLVEMSLAIGASRFLPIVKRTLGYGTSCSLVNIRVTEREPNNPLNARRVEEPRAH
jgi:alkylhydroperoxidase family enzyme